MNNHFLPGFSDNNLCIFLRSSSLIFLTEECPTYFSGVGSGTTGVSGDTHGLSNSLFVIGPPPVAEFYAKPIIIMIALLFVVDLVEFAFRVVAFIILVVVSVVAVVEVVEVVVVVVVLVVAVALVVVEVVVVVVVVDVYD